MELIVILVVIYALLAPAALIIGLVALTRIRDISDQISSLKFTDGQEVSESSKFRGQIEETLSSADEVSTTSPPMPEVEPQPAEIASISKETSDSSDGSTSPVRQLTEVDGREDEVMGLEQRIGTKWVLIAGVITTLVGVGFFLKYAYDNNLIGPMGRVMIAAAAGIAALIIGEWTRRRDYGIVARGLTALGFAILYATVFGAYNFYRLIESEPAFGISIIITLSAMLYAVSLNDVLVAFLVLLGGFMSPVLLSTGENRPMVLFTYVSLLSVGAMFCAFFRKWRLINLLAFFGTFILYTGWFVKFYRPAMKHTEGIPEQLSVAIVWLSVFFFIFLVLPVLYELVRRVKARKEDVRLILLNAMVVFYYLYTILFDRYREALAFSAVAMAAAHLVLMVLVYRRCPRDVALRLSLLSISIFFITVAIPLYLKMYSVAMVWAAEGVILTLIGLRYRSTWTRVSGFVTLALSCCWLCYCLPLHTVAFQIVVNKAFGSWCFVAAGFCVCHVIYRRTTIIDLPQRRITAEVLYAALLFLLLATVSMEWYCHTRYNLMVTETGQYHEYFRKGMVLFLVVFMLLFVLRPVRPPGQICRLMAALIGITGSIFTLIAFSEFYYGRFRIFFNGAFLIGLLFVSGLFAGAVLLRRQKEDFTLNRRFALGFSIAGIFVLWLLTTEEIYLYWHHLGKATHDLIRCRFLGQMYISVIWAIYATILMIIGFWRKIVVLRFIALGLFAILIGKVFVFDTAHLKNVYRITGFVVLGITLVGISYLYQYGKKKGLFDSLT